MGTKVKGLLKGLRYISQIFDADGKEQEMQIGFPTDVKHVAHIGWDGPSVGAPSWMNEFRSAPLSTAAVGDARDSSATPKWPADDLPLPKSSRRNTSNAGTGLESPSRETRPSRRNQSAGAIESPTGEPTEGSRHRRSKGGSSGSGSGINGGCESPARDLPAVPKQARRKKTKGGSGGSSKSSKTKANASDDRSGEQLREVKVVDGEDEKL